MGQTPQGTSEGGGAIVGSRAPGTTWRVFMCAAQLAAGAPLSLSDQHSEVSPVSPQQAPQLGRS